MWAADSSSESIEQSVRTDSPGLKPFYKPYIVGLKPHAPSEKAERRTLGKTQIRDCPVQEAM